MLFASIWDSFLTQVWYRYSANILQHWVGGRGLIYFCKVDHSRIFINFSRNWLGLNNLCEILWPRGAMDGQLSLDWPRSAIAPRNMAPSLIRICRIQWYCSLFFFSSGNTLFGQIWSNKLKSSVQGETLDLNHFKYAEFNGDVHLFCFWVEIPFLGKFGPKNQNF